MGLWKIFLVLVAVIIVLNYIINRKDRIKQLEDVMQDEEEKCQSAVNRFNLDNTVKENHKSAEIIAFRPLPKKDSDK